TMILSTLQKFGFFATYGGILEDKKEILKQTLQSPYDVIFTTGGASKGEADFMRMVLEESGAKMLVNGIKIKPGKPTMVAKLGEKFIIALPGNPLSAGVLLRLLVLPFLRQISGAKSHYPQVLEIKNANFMKLNNRAEVMLGRIGEHGFCLTKEGKYNSGEILPLAQSNAIALFDESCKEVEKGANVKILPYETLWGDSVCDIANH
ncbi:MAG: molybdopterin molybdenumtransferase MoeA, partial [Helicobacter sp.]|nr:molybdopterin molybdenumtransferase MoeA [Helicobacter sp.]